MSARLRPLVVAFALAGWLAGAAAAQPAPSGERAGAAAAPGPEQAAIGPIPGVGEPEPRKNPVAGDPNALQNGRSLFVTMNCAGCHGTHAGGGMGPSLRDEAWIYGGNAGDIFNSIAQGRANGMPAWGTMLPEPSIWNITAYIESLRTPNEPDPPR
jgi:cytochrome c oxidase cbb3-type subunit 3